MVPTDHARTCPPTERIVAFVEGRLGEDARAHVEHHIGECSLCPLLIARSTEHATPFPDESLAIDSSAATLHHTLHCHERLGAGDTIGRYTIERLIGVGGMGDVYLATDPELQRNVAVKRLRRASVDASERARIVREGQLMARLSHPNVLPVFDVGLEDGQVFIAMHYARGGTLRSWLSVRRRSWQEIRTVFLAAARGLAAAHAKALVHRDFKPDNVLLDEVGDRDDHVFIVDFGLARDASFGPSSPGPTEVSGREFSGSFTQSLTRTGFVLGTPAYMAPEQHLGQKAGPAADQFAFCVALWEACYGARPFDASTLPELCERKMRGELPQPPRDRGIPPRLHALMLEGLRPSPEERFASIEALIDALERVRPARRLPIALGIATCTIAGAAWSHPDEACDHAPRAASVWNVGAKTRLKAAFLAEQTAYAERTGAVVERQLDAYVDAWTRTRAQLCDAGEDDSSFDERIHCLDRRIDNFEAVVRILRTQTPEILDRATRLAQELRPPERCLDPELDSLTLRPFESSKLPSELLSVRRLLDQADILRKAGRYEAALRVGGVAIERARAQDAAPPLLAEALLDGVIGQLSLSRFAEGRAAAREAFFLARQSGYERLVLEAATRLVELHAHAGDLQQAETWLRQAEVAFMRSGAAPRDERKLAHARAILGFYAHDFERGLAAAARAVELARELDDRGEGVAAALRLQADLHARATHHTDALSLYEESLEIRSAYLPPEHPVLLEMRTSIADQLRGLGRYEDAQRQFRELLALQEKSPAPMEKQIAQTLLLLAGIEPPKEGLPHIRRALAIFEKINGVEDVDTIASYDVLAMVLLGLGRLDEARQALLTASAARERLVGADQPDHVWELTLLAEIAAKQQRFDRAIARAEQAVALTKRHLGSRHQLHTWSLRVLGSMHLAAGDATKGCEVLRTTLPAIRMTHGEAHPVVHEVALDVASCLAKDGHTQQATTALETLLADEAVAPLVRARIELQLARAYATLERLEEARHLAEQAREHVGTATSANEADVLREIKAFIDGTRS